jgi:DNA (cytosine-5)-methyltransferase 1
MARTGTPADAVACPPLIVQTNHDDSHAHHVYPAGSRPLPPRTTKIGDAMLVPSGGTWNTEPTWTDEPMRTRLANEKGYEGLVCPPFIAELRNHAEPSDPTAEPLSTLNTARHHALTVPAGAFHMKVNSGNCAPGQATDEVGRPFGGITAKDTTALVIPYRRGRAKTVLEPLHTLGTHDSAGLVSAEVDVDDCLFRMLQPREHLRAQRFPDSYIVTGNKGEQTMQAGNAVSANVAQWLGEALMEVL